MEDISCITEKRERDPREHPFKRNMVASDPDGMVKALGSRDAPSKRNLVEGAQKGARHFVNEEKNLRMRTHARGSAFPKLTCG